MIPTINKDYCKGCDICIAFCPRDVYEKTNNLSTLGFALPTVKNAEVCFNYDIKESSKIRCAICFYMCPEHAITYISNEDED